MIITAQKVRNLQSNNKKEKIVKKKEFDFNYVRDNRNKKKGKREDKREVDWIS